MSFQAIARFPSREALLDYLKANNNNLEPIHGVAILARITRTVAATFGGEPVPDSATLAGRLIGIIAAKDNLSVDERDTCAQTWATLLIEASKQG